MAEHTNTPEQASKPRLIPGHAWPQIVIIGILFLLLHSYVLGLLFNAGKDPNWSHIYLVPFLSIYLVYRQRDHLKRQPVWRDFRGLLVFFLGLAGYSAGIHLHSTMIMGYAMVAEILGLVWFFVGANMLRTLWVPIIFLLFGVKFTFVYTYISLILQHVASAAGAVIVNLIGIGLDIEADSLGSLLAIYHNGALIEPPLNVEDACSGLRSLMALGAISAVLAFMDKRPWYSCLCIIACSVPVAVVVNVFRISVTGLIYPYNPELCHGGPHELLGLLMLIPAMFILAGLTKVFDRIWGVKNWSHADH